MAITMKSGRGGHREGAGRKSSWKHGKTKTIRVPEALAERLLEIARLLDEGGFLSQDDNGDGSTL